eukprot:gnl/TRDRNA2_/TRDRNA2_187681_c0_seq1.p1 gnl/TRDRNA2_/TRDRNA2_187681_c0~~gnl/TRDRNA2_/TRDRNA2_187681_c0_seq1.p1  ORF type:complete len:283 (+),score=49.30 gnl/TRDRNA2_/TRDRNA2_187681_c0_seq1:48-851(+)
MAPIDDYSSGDALFGEGFAKRSTRARSHSPFPKDNDIEAGMTRYASAPRLLDTDSEVGSQVSIMTTLSMMKLREDFSAKCREARRLGRDVHCELRAAWKQQKAAYKKNKKKLGMAIENSPDTLERYICDAYEVAFPKPGKGGVSEKSGSSDAAKNAVKGTTNGKPPLAPKTMKPKDAATGTTSGKPPVAPKTAKAKPAVSEVGSGKMPHLQARSPLRSSAEEWERAKRWEILINPDVDGRGRVTDSALMSSGFDRRVRRVKKTKDNF